MTSAMPTSNADLLIDQIRGLNADEQLALLWVVYTKAGNSITPAAPDAASPQISGGLFDQVKQLEQQEQLQAMRDIVVGKDVRLSREYGSLGAETKLAFWYQLACGMEDGSIIPVPDDYSTPSGATQLVGKLESLGFEEQITALRKLADGMGANPASGSEI